MHYIELVVTEPFYRCLSLLCASKPQSLQTFYQVLANRSAILTISYTIWTYSLNIKTYIQHKANNCLVSVWSNLASCHCCAASSVSTTFNNNEPSPRFIIYIQNLCTQKRMSVCVAVWVFASFNVFQDYFQLHWIQFGVSALEFIGCQNWFQLNTQTILF